MYVDSDWGGDVSSRRSTSGGTIMLGTHILTRWCKAQSIIALSSGEAELNAAVKGITETIGVIELLRELKMEAKTKVMMDSSAGEGILMRKGVGQSKHLSIEQLWVQSAVPEYDIEILKVPRRLNVADLLTHACDKRDFHERLNKLSIERPGWYGTNKSEEGCRNT